MAALWATHLVDEAENADKVLILHHGELRASGTAEELMTMTSQSSLLDAFLSLSQNNSHELIP